MTALYNEFDPKKAAWLRELIKRDVIAPGVVDERSIIDIRPAELQQYTQVHLCAGIGIWSYALRAAGWPDECAVWTVSEPCQPHSTAGKRLGDADERYIRPAVHHAISHGKRPDIPVYGEQVANGDGLAWFDTLSADMESEGHAVRAFDLCSAGFGAPHIRQRLYWMAYAAQAKCDGDVGGQKSERRSGFANRIAACGVAHPTSSGQQRRGAGEEGDEGKQTRLEFKRLCHVIGMGNVQREGLERYSGHGNGGEKPGRIDSESRGSASAPGEHGELGDTTRGGCGERGHEAFAGSGGHVNRPGPTNGFWGSADWLFCRDGRWRPVRPGSFPLAHGAAARVLRLRGYGDGINAAQATHFIEITKEIMGRFYGK